VDDDFLSRWLDSCFVVRDPNVTTWRRASNMKNILRSLYFLLLWDNMALSLLEQISSQLKRLDAPYVETGTSKA
jgi:ubiquitin-protein ligase